MRRYSILSTIALLVVSAISCSGQQQNNEEADSDSSKVIFNSLDNVPITAQLYWAEESSFGHDATRPFIILCHQAGWSRGEYQEIAPKLNALGFNCIAIDQRSGGEVNGISNETLGRAKSAGHETSFVDAEQDILATIQRVRDADYAKGKLILWGSSYSASLVLRIAGEQPELVDGVLAFAPGEYFERLEKPKDWIASSAKNISVPTFITSAKNETKNWSAIFDAIPGDSKVKFIPETKGNHGSRALWEQFDDSDVYWDATREFLNQFPEPDADSVDDNQDSAQTFRRAEDIEGLPGRIAFGSCSHQNKPQPALTTIVGKHPDLFIYLGDNIYGDTKDMKVLQEKYEKLGARTVFQNLRQNVPVLSIWDDHDYGWNDAGKEYEFKAQSKEIFMDFWQVPQDSPRRNHDGIYGSHRYEAHGHVLQIVLLDTRTFRDPLKRNSARLPDGSLFKNEYQPDSDPDKTLLGDAQWQWLEATLREPADIRIICSSIQFGHEYNGWESWTNLPHEQDRMVAVIRDTGATGVIFVSGDVHWGEISKREYEGLYPLFDVTASGLTEEWYNVEPNRYRVGDPVRENHFGIVEIDWNEQDPTIALQIVDVPGNVRTQHQMLLSELKN